MSGPGELRSAEDLPELLDAVLVPDDVARLEADLSACAEVVRVVPRERRRGAGPPSTVALADGFARLRSGDAVGLQIHYRFEDELWCDTLIPAVGGVRLVRMRQSDER